MIKAGIGYDLHKLVRGRKLIIGGVEIESEWGCLAHSDGDVLVHSIIDSLLSVTSEEDIGTVFPDNNKDFKDISSLKLLEIVKEKYLKAIKILSIDNVIIIDKPKISPYIREMKGKIAKILAIPEEFIGIKGKTSENTKMFSIECYTVTIIEK